MLKTLARSLKTKQKKDMVDPLDGLIALQEAIDDGFEVDACDIYSDISTVYDTPQNTPRMTYVKIESGEIQTYSVFIMVEPINGVICFNIGYATIEKHRNKGLAFEIIQKSINELKNGLNRNNISKFYIEAIIDVKNNISQKIAKNLISKDFKKVTDSHSGKPAYCYTRLIKKTNNNLEYILNNKPPVKNILDPKSREYFDIRLFSIMAYASELANDEMLSLIFHNIANKTGYRYQCKGKVAIEEGKKYVNDWIRVCIHKTFATDEKSIKLYASIVISGKVKNADLSGLRKYAEQNLADGEEGVTQEGIDELNNFVFEKLETYKKFPSESEFLG